MKQPKWNGVIGSENRRGREKEGKDRNCNVRSVETTTDSNYFKVPGSLSRHRHVSQVFPTDHDSWEIARIFAIFNQTVGIIGFAKIVAGP